jgi:3-deoxy-manno-octulosonate cytidylyltransferase (CMP-KDO synthetase)
MDQNQTKQKVLGVISARIGSTRIPRKMLIDINGKTLIRRSYERSITSKKMDMVIVATDSDEIEAEAKSFGARVIRSIRDHQNGTERTAEAITLFTDFAPDTVVTIWGDEPLYPASVIDDCIDFFQTGRFDVVIPSFKIDNPKLVTDNSVGKVVMDINGRILYLSRSPIPHNYKNADIDYYHASGAMIMRPEFFKTYMSLPRIGLEAAEDVEQLRILEQGYSIGTIKTDHLNHGVNTPEDLLRVIEVYREREG